MILMKNIYEEKLNQLQSDNDDKQKKLYENQNQLNILDLKL